MVLGRDRQPLSVRSMALPLVITARSSFVAERLTKAILEVRRRNLAYMIMG